MTLYLTNRGGPVMRFATAFLVIVVLGWASSAHAIFTETFDTMTGGTVDAQNGWHSGTSAGGNGVGFIGGGHGSAPMPSLNLSGPGGPDGSQAVSGEWNAGFGIASARDITADKAGDGSYEVIVDAFAGNNPSGGVRFGIGSADSVLRSNVAHEQFWGGFRNCPTATSGCESGTRGVFEAGTYIAANDGDGAGTGPPTSINATAVYTDASINVHTDWIQIRFQTDGSGNLTLQHRALSTGGAWLNALTSSAPLTNGAADVQALQLTSLTGTYDNLVSGVVPEPASMSLLALGGLLLLGRRRRRA